jgi:hypothetical protein
VPELWKSKLPNGHDDSSSSDEPVNVITIGALCCLWFGLVTFGWARWGSVTVDSGREIYVAAALAQGKMLYRDVWYPYGPGAPCLNALLFRIFGIHITLAYLARGSPSRAGRGANTVPLCSVPHVFTVAFSVGYIYYFGVWEPNITRWIVRRLASGDMFIDVGANVGYYSLLASKLVGESGSVVRFYKATSASTGSEMFGQ